MAAKKPWEHEYTAAAPAADGAKPWEAKYASAPASARDLADTTADLPGAEHPDTPVWPLRDRLALAGTAADDAVRLLASGVTMGGADRLASILPGGGTLEQERAATEASRQRAGKLALPLEIGGALATAPLMPSAGLAKGASLLSRMGVGATEGAVLGGLGGALTSDEGGDWKQGAKFGGAAGAAGPLIGKLISPFSGSASRLSPEQRRLLGVMDQEGVPLPAGARTNSNLLKWADAATADLPGGQTATQNMKQAYNRAAGSKASIQADYLDTGVIGARNKALGLEMDDLAASARPRIDHPFVREAFDMRSRATDVLTGEQQGKLDTILKEINRHSVDHGGAVTSEYYQTLRTRLRHMADGADPQLKPFARELQGAWDGLAERHLPPHLQGKWQTARQQYAELMRLREATSTGSPAALEGSVTGPALNNAVKNADAAAYSLGRSPSQLEDLGRAGSMFMRDMPNSGTAQRLGMMAGASTLGAVGGAAATGDFSGALKGSLAGLAPPLLGSIYRTSPAQRLLLNKAVAPGAGNALGSLFARSSPLLSGLLDK